MILLLLALCLGQDAVPFAVCLQAAVSILWCLHRCVKTSLIDGAGDQVVAVPYLGGEPTKRRILADARRGWTFVHHDNRPSNQ